MSRRHDDVEHWETLAFIWICEAEAERGEAWARFCAAYPGHEEEVESFWERMLKTEWYAKHGHKHHYHKHHGEYGDEYGCEG